MHLEDPPGLRFVSSPVSQCKPPSETKVFYSLLLGHGLVHHRKYRKMYDQALSGHPNPLTYEEEQMVRVHMKVRITSLPSPSFLIS